MTAKQFAKNYQTDGCKWFLNGFMQGQMNMNTVTKTAPMVKFGTA